MNFTKNETHSDGKGGTYSVRVQMSKDEIRAQLIADQEVYEAAGGEVEQVKAVKPKKPKVTTSPNVDSPYHDWLSSIEDGESIFTAEPPRVFFKPLIDARKSAPVIH